MELKYQGIQKYNTDIKFCGNNVSIKLYDEYQLKGYKVENGGSFDGGFPKHREEIERLMESYCSEQTKIKCRLKLEELELLRKDRWHRTNRRAKQRVMDLVACNANKLKDFNGKKQYTKFITLTFQADNEDTRNLEWCNNELAKYMKRICYRLYGIRKNVLKYISVPELQNRGVWHFHIIIFNMEYVKHERLLQWWGNGSVNVKAIKVDSEGMVSRYVVKYMTDSLEEKEENSDNKKSAEYEKYIELGLENTRRYNPSRGLIQPEKMSYNTYENELQEAVKFLAIGGYLEQLSNQENNFIDYQVCESEDRGKITYINFTIKDKKVLEDFKGNIIENVKKRSYIWVDKYNNIVVKKVLNKIKNNIAINRSVGKDLEWYYKKLNNVSYRDIIRYCGKLA